MAREYNKLITCPLSGVESGACRLCCSAAVAWIKRLSRYVEYFHWFNMNCYFRKVHLGALLHLSFFCGLGFFHSSQSILQGLRNSWLGDKLWNPIFHQGQKGLVVRSDNVPQVQLWSLFTFSKWSPVSIRGADYSPLCVVACPDDDDRHIQIPRCGSPLQLPAPSSGRQSISLHLPPERGRIHLWCYIMIVYPRWFYSRIPPARDGAKERARLVCLASCYSCYLQRSIVNLLKKILAWILLYDVPF